MIFQEVQSPVQQRQKQAKKNASSVVRIKLIKETKHKSMCLEVVILPIQEKFFMTNA